MCSTTITGTLKASYVLMLFCALFMIHCAPPGAGLIRRDGEGRLINAHGQDEGVRTLRFSWDDGETAGRDGGVAYYSPEEERTRRRPDNDTVVPPVDRSDEGDGPRRNTISGASKHRTPAVRGRNSAHNDQGKSTKDSSSSMTLRYRVKKGDTLYSLSRRYNCTVDELCAANRMKKTDPLLRGRMVTIPCAGTGSAPEKRPADTHHTAATHARLRFNWPVQKVTGVSRDGGGGVKPIGVEITGQKNSPVVSAAPGVVKKIGEMRGYGTYIIISHNQRYVTVYAGVKDVQVSEGDSVAARSIIARIDGDGRVIFQIGRSGKPVDPLRLLPGRG